MSTFDALSSVAYMLVGVMAPYEAGFYLSRGNETTCNIQGFMIQLGQTASMLYNLFLSLYFFFVIVYGWREARFKKMSIWVHAFVVLSGVGLAVAAIPFIEAQFGVCGILPPLTSSRWQISLFYTGPVSTVLFVLTVSTVVICRSVYMQERRARKWKFVKNKISMTREVFWQSFWYVSAFHVTIPLMLVAFYAPFKFPRGFWIFIVTAILAPLQGLMNAFVYFKRAKRSTVKISCGYVFGWLRCSCYQSFGSAWDKRRPHSSSRKVPDMFSDEPTATPADDTLRNSQMARLTANNARSTKTTSMSVGNMLDFEADGVEEDELGSGEDDLRWEGRRTSRLSLDEGIMDYWALNEEESRSDVFGSSGRPPRRWQSLPVEKSTGISERAYQGCFGDEGGTDSAHLSSSDSLAETDVLHCTRPFKAPDRK